MYPIIGIPCATLPDLTWQPDRFAQRRSYVDALAAAGAAPVLLPLLPQPELLAALYAQLDGLLLAGGHDIDPQCYGHARHPRTERSDPARDEVEMQLVRWAVRDSKPVLGICRGNQALNVALGGTLYQHTPEVVPDGADHEEAHRLGDGTHLSHMLRVLPESRLAGLLGTTSLRTNSLHHQAVRDLAPGLRAVGWADDGLIEAVESSGPGFAVGVQCHPEELWHTSEPRWQRLFVGFVEAVRNAQQPPRSAEQRYSA